MRFVRVFCALLLNVALATENVIANDGWLPLNRSQLMQLLAPNASDEPVKLDSWDALTRVIERTDSGSAPNTVSYWAGLLSDLPERFQGQATLAAGETISFATNPAIPLTIVMAGKDEAVHSIRITAPVVNYSERESERVFVVLSTLFERVYPAWPAAGEWPRASLLESWSPDRKEAIIRHQLGGITSATFGVPPDIVVYTIAAREDCVPNVDKGNPFERLAC